ncbi:hypothetical protein J2741_001641 [Methanolinea mesophila]|uniref:DNA methyltransferase n=1 Tax=Methanolinea mesophila TaxID=547055 RepID=UPI001AE98EB6|nr:DNA methyltransferase [Methanolinea mesophila]MBP1929094.1 hypothetical protein [Methanolinea mesophila]
MDLRGYLQKFRLSDTGRTGPGTRTDYLEIGGETVPRFTNEFWTPAQRKASSLQEISYRACFKPQLPRFFINLLTRPGDRVYDPFSGRGTTVLEAGLMGRQVVANDINPLSRILTAPRFFIPSYAEVAERLGSLVPPGPCTTGPDLSMFYHPDTLEEILSLRAYLCARRESGKEDRADRWIRMVATNRLTGHSPGFFSVYTLPPNQAASPEGQRKINARRAQSPEYRDTRAIILKKTRSLTKDLTPETVRMLEDIGGSALFLCNDSRCTPDIHDNSVNLTVTSPPFLDVVQYSKDNWLRCWFNGIDPGQIEEGITITRSLGEWSSVMEATFEELYRITAPGGHVAFEVGEVRNRTLRLDEAVVPLGTRAGFSCLGIVVHEQAFTKTSHIWGIGNNSRGTNTNRIVLFSKK